MKEEVLCHLRMNEGKYVSGEALSRLFGVSRAAVWKDIRTLQSDGYVIEAVPKLGYRLLSGPDRLSAGNLLPLLQGIGADGLLCLESVDSTNDLAKRLVLQGRHTRCYITAEEQTGGRGRRGRSFYSPKGSGLYLTGLYFPEKLPSLVSNFTAYVAVAVCRAVEAVCEARPAIKWPNDILLEGKKLCGILTEMAFEGETGAAQYLITGMGINVSQKPEDFPEDIRAVAVSLETVLGHAVSRTRLCAALIGELEAAYEAFLREDKSCREQYRERCATLGQDIFIISGESRVPATALGLADDFGLIVRCEDGREQTIYAGEVSVRGQS